MRLEKRKPYSWTPERLAEAEQALARLPTIEAAKHLGVSIRALRGALNRNKISLRDMRPQVEKHQRSGFFAPCSSLYGASALAELSDEGCRWPMGSPSVKGFKFCGCPRVSLKPYCMEHLERAKGPPA
jgi:hypothetical protein